MARYSTLCLGSAFQVQADRQYASFCSTPRGALIVLKSYWNSEVAQECPLKLRDISLILTLLTAVSPVAGWRNGRCRAAG